MKLVDQQFVHAQKSCDVISHQQESYHAQYRVTGHWFIGKYIQGLPFCHSLSLAMFCEDVLFLVPQSEMFSFNFM